MRNRFLKLEKISWKLTLLYSLLFSVVLLLLSAGVLYGVRYFLFEQAYETVRSSSEETISNILDKSGSESDLHDSELLSEAQSDSDINIAIADSQGKIVNESTNYTIKENDVTFRPGIIRRVKNDGKRLMILNSMVMSGNSVIGYLQVAYNLEKSYKFMEILFMLLAVSDALGIVLSILVGYAVSRRMLRPIDKITKTAQSISINDLGRRIPAGKADDEITRLAVTFNDMLDRLKDSVDRQGRFVSDASHELRTPVSVILGYAGLLDRGGKNDRKVLQESVDAIKNETIGMHELIEKLLFLARSDGSKTTVSKEPVDLLQLLADVADESRMIAPGKDISVDVFGNPALNADRRMMKQMLRNLVDNSIKFTKPDGSIAIHAEKAGGDMVKITVEDNGIGIPSDEIGHIFDRFYRVDKTRAKVTGGSGLGLSIVKSIVDAHGGEISIESTPENGTHVTIFLPKA
jgi:two-component system, OmpR family, sensor histidine kinase ArlS